MVVEKKVAIKLFFNRAENMFYIQIGEDSLFKIKATIATRVQEKEQIEIVFVDSIKQMQTITNKP